MRQPALRLCREPAPHRRSLCRPLPRVRFCRRACDRLLLVRAKPSTLTAMALYAGFDCSTQSLSAVVIDTETRSIAFHDSVVFDRPFLTSTQPGVVHADPRMWADALRRHARHSSRRPSTATGSCAISGAAQQHGSVYCGSASDGSDPRDITDLDGQQHGAGVRRDRGDARRRGRCRAAHRFARVPRFTGPQIRKFWREDPAAYARTARIHLVSSYLASLLIGEHAPIDHADGSGMNLMDLRTGEWSAARARRHRAAALDKLPRARPLVQRHRHAEPELAARASTCRQCGSSPGRATTRPAWSGRA